jgi:hypothetical protein
MEGRSIFNTIMWSPEYDEMTIKYFFSLSKSPAIINKGIKATRYHALKTCK